jgi:anti-sigma factor RsiW
MKCEEWRLAAMALTDGETPPTSRAEIEAHLAECEGCRRETDQLQELGQIWQGQARRNYKVDLWPQIHDSLSHKKRYWLPMLVVLLAIFKLADLIPDWDLAIWIQLFPILMASAIFAALRENPFQIIAEFGSRETES